MCESEFECQDFICTLSDSIHSFIARFHSQIIYSDDYGDKSHDESEDIGKGYGDDGDDNDDTKRHG